MLKNCRSAKERWGGVNTIIDRWLQERQEMLVSYCALSTIDTFSEDNSDHRQRVRHFCQILMDYISAGHFEVYDQLIKEGRDFGDKDALKAAAKPYTAIDTTTEKLLDFNDKYQETDDMSSLAADLSSTGQQLASRFEAEDEMISILHDSHTDMVA
jgi:regulator of sigma D